MRYEFEALRFRREGHVDRAIEIYRKQLATDPLDHHARWQLAVTLSQNGDKNAALQEAQKTIELGGRSFGIYMLLADLLRDRGDWDEALAAGDELVRMNPRHCTPHAIVGRIHSARGDLASSIESLERAASFHPTAEMLLALAELYEEAGRSDDADDTYERIFDSMPTFCTHSLRLGKLLASQSQHAQARQQWQFVLKLLR